MTRRSSISQLLLLLPITFGSGFVSRASPAAGRTSVAIPLRDIDTAQLVEAIEGTDCKAFKTPGAEDRKEDVVVNGTAKRVKQNPLGKFADAVSASVFAALHFNDNLGIKDSSKNLRVLWSRAYLNYVGAINDSIAYELLPPNTRDIIRLLPRSGPLVNFQEFITSRTEFIDSAVDSFLAAGKESQKPQIVLFGAGYDTRSLRYSGRANFFEVDLQDVVDGKGRLHQYYREKISSLSEELPKRIGYDLNDASDPLKPSLTTVLTDAGLHRDVPVLFIWEAVLFYVKPDAVMSIFEDVFNYGDQSAVCLVDSLKPAVTTSFLHDTRAFFDKYDLDVIDHNSRWGGAVHFALTGRRDASLTHTMKKGREELPFSYLPTSVKKGIEAQDSSSASFNNHWYAVAYPWQIDGSEKNEPFVTRLWGEPIVIYRDADGNLVCAKDVCPHRSAPLSMSKMNKDGRLECMYHGWAFGKNGSCESIPTQKNTKNENKNFLKRACLKTYAIQEHEGLVWVWRGNVLEADATKLPTTRKDISTYPCDTVLDYNVDWKYIVENNLDSPHLFWLHDGSVPPVRSLNFVKEKVNQMKLKFFQDDSGQGHYGHTKGGKPKIVRFDAPNIVRHGGVSSFSEEFHIVPIAPGRTRVLLRQNLPKGPILTTVLSVPGLEFVLQRLVQLWNYHISLEDYSVMQGQAHNVDDLGAPHLALGDLGDDLVQKFYRWKASAEENDGSLPYFAEWKKKGKDLQFQAAREEKDVSSETSFNVIDDGQSIDGRSVGTYGILKSYNQRTPFAEYPPINYQMYKPLLDLDQRFRADAPGNKVSNGTNEGQLQTARYGTIGAGMVFTMAVGTAAVFAQGTEIPFVDSLFM